MPESTSAPMDQPTEALSSPSFGAQHPAVASSPIPVAPATMGELNTVRVRLLPVACWRMNHVLFDFDSSVIVPAIRDELARLSDVVSRNPGARPAIFGHADPTGNDAYNKTLSGRRARSIYALLTRKPEIWDSLYTNTEQTNDLWGGRAIQTMLHEVLDGEGNPYFQGPFTGNIGPITTESVQRFKQDRQLGAGGEIDRQTRLALFRAYMDAVCLGPDNPFTLDAMSFLGADGPSHRLSCQACGEFNPVTVFSEMEEASFARAGEKATRDEQNAPNRRVMIFFFPAKTEVDPAAWPCPSTTDPPDGCRAAFWPDAARRRQPGGERREYRETRDTMACRFYDRLARRSPCEGIVLPVVRIRLFDLDSRPIAEAPYEIVGEGWSTRGTAVNSYAVVHNVAVPATCLVRWSRPDAERRRRLRDPSATLLPFEYEETIYLDTKQHDGPAAAARRLSNLGHGACEDLIQATCSFQTAYGLPVTGQFADIEQALSKRHDRCEPGELTITYAPEVPGSGETPAATSTPNKG